MGTKTRTNLFLKECLADALIKLLENRPIEKITIPEIASSAGVGRTTYFRNFSSKEEMLTFKFLLLWDRWADDHDLRNRNTFSFENVLSFFEFIYSIRPLLELIYRRGLQSALLVAFHSYMTPDLAPQERYRIGFYSYGLFGLLEELILGGFKESPEQMEKIIKAFRTNGHADAKSLTL